MKYRIDIRRKAEKFIRKLPRQDKERVLSAIYRLPEGEDIKATRVLCACVWAITVSYTGWITGGLSCW